MLAQLGAAQVATDLHVAKKAEALTLGDALKATSDRLDTRVIRRHAITHQAEWRGQTLKHVHLGARQLLHQCFGGIKAARA